MQSSKCEASLKKVCIMTGLFSLLREVFVERVQVRACMAEALQPRNKLITN